MTEEIIADYDLLVRNLPRKRRECKAADYPAKVMKVLVARDKVANSLGNNVSLPPSLFDRLVKADQALKEQARNIVDSVRGSTLGDWREARRSAVDAWWWSLEEQVSKPSPFWLIVTWGCCILSAFALSGTIEIIRRLTNVKTDLWSASLQGLLGLVAGGAVLQIIWQLIAGVPRFGLGQKFQLSRKKLMLLTSITLIVVSVVYDCLPKLAESYIVEGLNFQKSNHPFRALESFQHAVNIAPDNAAAHSALGTAYENMRDYEKATSEHEIAHRLDNKNLTAKVRLARVYLESGKEDKRSIALVFLEEVQSALDKIENLNEQQKSDEYSMRVNRARAKIQEKDFKEAWKMLETPLTQSEKGGAPFCLMAQLLEEAWKDRKDWLAEWLEEQTPIDCKKQRQKEEQENQKPNFLDLLKKELGREKLQADVPLKMMVKYWSVCLECRLDKQAQSECLSLKHWKMCWDNRRVQEEDYDIKWLSVAAARLNQDKQAKPNNKDFEPRTKPAGSSLPGSSGQRKARQRHRRK